MSIKFILGDITKIKADAIVNAASESLLGGGGVDGAIHRAAGPELLEFTSKLGGAKTTEAKLSPAFKLPAKYIIHAVGPVYIDGKHGEQSKLYMTYKNALILAEKHKIKSIAFPLISAGAYGFPKKLAIDTATTSIQDFLENHVIDVLLVFYNKETFANLSEDKYKDLLKYIGENFIEEETDYQEKFSAHAHKYNRKIEILYSRDDISAEEVYDVSPTIDEEDTSFADKLNLWMNKKNIVNDMVWKKANIDRKLFSKIYCGGHPSKKTAILLTLALELGLDDSLDLLSRAGYTLSNSIKEDLVVKWHIEKKIYSVFEVCKTLIQLQLSPLF